jgi:hypothetical protein
MEQQMINERKLIKAINKSTLEFPDIHESKTGQKGNLKFTYSDIDSILDVIHPILAKNGVCINWYIKVLPQDKLEVLQLILEHEDTGEQRISECLLDSSLIDDKEYNAHTTSRQRNLLNKALGLRFASKIDDPFPIDKLYPLPIKSYNKPEPLTPNSFTTKISSSVVMNLKNKSKEIQDELLKTYAINNLEDLTVHSYNEFVRKQSNK